MMTGAKVTPILVVPSGWIMKSKRRIPQVVPTTVA